MKTLSIIIPARNEMFLNRTIEDILASIQGDTDIIVVLDGYWENIPQHERVTVIHNPVSIGQRASTNQAVKLSKAKYVMKVDAHCAFDKGFDVKLMDDMQDDWTVVPVMRNLHAFDWVCEGGHRRYQGPSGVCTECGKETTMDVVWIAKTSPQSTSYCFDSEPHFQYFGEYKKKQIGDIVETMSLQGSCFMLTREKYWELDICDEAFGSWGSQGIEVAVKTWLSGGSVMVNKKTWYAHLFRTQGGDFGFPYPQSGKQVDHAKKFARELFFDNKWPKQVRPLSWLVEKFDPPENFWSKEDREKLKAWGLKNKEIVYYTSNDHDKKIASMVREQLLKSGYPITTVSLNEELDFGDKRITVQGEKGILMMHTQILLGLEASTADTIFLCEHDVLYHPSHFDFIPKRDDVFYYNTNVWRARWPDGHAVWTDDLQQVSGVCANRKVLIEHYRKKIEQIQAGEFDGHYEPGVKQKIFPYIKGGKYGSENYQSKFPNICIRHDKNLTKSKWSPEEFKDPKYSKGWKETDEYLSDWGKLSELFNQ